MQIGTKLKITRITKGHKQKDVALELNINRSVLNLYENNKRTISGKHEKAIAKYINE